MLPEKKWLTIEEVAERWGKKPRDVQYYLLSGELRASLLLPCLESDLGSVQGICDIDKFTSFISTDKEEGNYVFYDGYFHNVYELKKNYSVKDVVITMENLKEFETKNISNNVGIAQQPTNSNIPQYLNEKNKHYSEELAAAIMAWEYAANQDPPENNFKALVEKYLKNRKLSKSARGRIATIANPHRNKGPRTKLTGKK